MRTRRSPTVVRRGWVFSVHLRLFGMVAAARQFGPWAPPAAMPDSDTVAWLLDCDDPSVRYFTLTLLGESADGVAAAKTRCRIMTEGAVPFILAAQREEGHRCERERFYTAKYTGTVWQLIILAQLGADGGDERLRRACEVILCDAQDAESGGFSVNCAKAVGGRHGSVIPCLTGNLIFSVIKVGYLDDPRVRRAIDWITTYQRFDDADGDAPTGWPYDPWEMCWGRHTCHRGAIKALKALAEKPPERCSSEVRRTLAEGVELRLRHMSTDAATTSRTTPNPAGGGSASRS